MNKLQQFWNNWVESIRVSNDKIYKDEIEDLKNKILQWEVQHEADREYIISKKEEIKLLSEEVEELNKDILSLEKDLGYDAIGEDWNNSRPKVNIKYAARPNFNGTARIDVDPRIFCTEDKLQTYTGNTYDEIVKKCLQWVINNIEYTPDSDQFKLSEVWLFPYETYNLRHGDCEDGAILLANMLLKSGIPYSRIRLSTGDVQGGGHCWCDYKKDDGTTVILDWCYWPNESKDLNLSYSKAKAKYFNTWFSFNKKYIFQGEKIE